MGLAVVCDEYFVPALEVLTDRMQISNDVAGATLMAAGGSAPELATSFLGVFIAKSDVGFGTIVGSAVFNVLFVIGMCAMASTDLVLTAWPLARDSSYYTFSLIVLYLFFGTVTKNRIDWYEALILFLLYIGYVVLMKYNEKLRPKFERLAASCCKKKTYAVTPLGAGKDKASETTAGAPNAAVEGSSGGTPSVANDTTDGGDEEDGKDSFQEDTLGELPKTGSSPPSKRRASAIPAELGVLNGRRVSTQFRTGVLSLLMGNNANALDILRVQAVAGVVGDVRETFDKFDTDKSGFIDDKELRQVLKDLVGSDPDQKQIETAMKALVSDQSEGAGGANQISFEEFKMWYLHSEIRVHADVHKVFVELDKSGDGRIDRSEIKTMITRLTGSEPTEAELQAATSDFKEESIDFQTFCKWYEKSLFFETHKTNNEEDAAAAEDEDEGVSLTPIPKGAVGRVSWLVFLPIMVPLYFTIPDVRWKSDKIKWENFYVVTFVMSIVWIGLYSCKSQKHCALRAGQHLFCVVRSFIDAFITHITWMYTNVLLCLCAPVCVHRLVCPDAMVWWATIFGDVCGIPQAVMGLTVLAAGTSVPDLMTSVIVARQGYGDMAVSSSIGSNIFDILIGLPIPW